MKKIWITGAEGHIGTALLELLEGVEYQLLPTDIHEVDITKIDEVTQFVYVNRPDVIINCAGMTDVAECEKNIDEAYRVNAIGVRNVVLVIVDRHESARLGTQQLQKSFEVGLDDISSLEHDVTSWPGATMAR